MYGGNSILLFITAMCRKKNILTWAPIEPPSQKEASEILIKHPIAPAKGATKKALLQRMQERMEVIVLD